MLFRNFFSIASVLSLTFSANAFCSADLKPEHKTFAQQLAAYCSDIQADMQNNQFPINTNGLELLASLSENVDFLTSICANIKDKSVYKSCVVGNFNLKSEIVGLKNSVKIYNQSKSDYAFHMIRDDLSMINLYLKHAAQ